MGFDNFESDQAVVQVTDTADLIAVRVTVATDQDAPEPAQAQVLELVTAEAVQAVPPGLVQNVRYDLRPSQEKVSSSQGSGSQQSSSSHGDGSEQSSSSEFTSTPPITPRVTPYNVYGVKVFRNTAEAIDRTGVEPRKAALILNAFREDISKGELNRNELIDPRKLENDTNKIRKQKIKQQEGKVIYGLGVDGRKDQTLVKGNVAGASGDYLFGRNIVGKVENDCHCKKSKQR